MRILQKIFPILLSCSLYTASCANEVTLPTLPTVPIPNMPNMPTSTLQNPSDSNPIIKPLQTITSQILKQKMLLQSVCIAEKIKTHENLSVHDVKKLGISHQLSPAQYQDNLLRLQNIELKAINTQMQKDLILKKNDLDNMLGVIEFFIANTQKHQIILFSNFLQIDGITFESNAKILHLFQTYFCHPYIFTTQSQNNTSLPVNPKELLQYRNILQIPSL